MTSPYASNDWRGRGSYEPVDDLPRLHHSDSTTPSLFTQAHRAPYTASPRNSIPDPSADTNADESTPYKSTSYTSAPYKDAADEPDLRHVRRYSRQWMSLSWNNQVKRRGTVPRIVYTVAGVIVIVLWVLVVVLFANQETKNQKKNLTEDTTRLKSLSLGDLGGVIILKGLLREFDVDARVLTVQWSTVYIADDGDTFQDMGTDDDHTLEINVYRDIQGIPDPETTELLHDETMYYKLDNTSAYRFGTVGLHPWDSFDTDIDMTQAVENDVWKQPMFGYPWDNWSGSIVMVATVAEMDRALEANGTGVFGLGAVTMEDSLLNWKITPKSWTPCIEVNSTSCELYIDFDASRPGIVIFCVIVVVIVNWICTVAIFLVTGEVILLRRKHILEGTDMLSVCFAALFALPTVRSLLPGAPQDFGAVIDFVGILPNVIIISLCTTVFACAKLRSRLKNALTVK